MARITVEDCLDKVDSQYDLVLLAKERTSQLNAGDKHLVSKNNDKNTVISLREIGEGKISIKTIEDNAINKLRKPQSEPTHLEDLEMDEEDSFDKIYKGEISKSGAAILPSKRARRMPEAIQASSKADNEQISSEDATTAQDQATEETQSEKEETQIEKEEAAPPTEEKTEE